MTTSPAESPSAAPPARVCTVTLAGDRFAVEVRYAREVVVFDEYTAIPLAPAHLLGVVNLRGHIVPLVDVRPLLGLGPARASRQARALVVERDGIQAGLLIDEVLGLEPLDTLVPAAEGDRADVRGTSAGRLERAGGAVTLLDVERLLAALGGDSQTQGEAR